MRIINSERSSHKGMHITNIMKTGIVGLFMLFFALTLQAQGKNDILFYVEKSPVSVDEFKYIYEKNNREQASYSQESLREYLDLYINFKLKVEKAKELKYDQNKSYKDELAGYRAQLADSYVINKEVISRIIDDIYSRQFRDIEVSHILINLDRNVMWEKELEALEAIQKVKKELDNGMTFTRAVNQFSQDRASAASGGNIGYITAPLPDGYVALENAAYNLKVGEVSDPIRTDRGYHLIQITDKREARGIMEAEHLLIRNKKNGIRLADALPRINKIYKDINEGLTSFNEATIKYSEDRETKGSGGSLGQFGIGQYEQSFEDGAFALESDGDISQPIETSIGYHIIRRVSKKEMPSREIISERVKSRPQQGERFELKRRTVIDNIKKEAGFSFNKELLTSFKESLDDSYFGFNWIPVQYEGEEVMSFDIDSYSIDQFSAFAKKSAKERMRAKNQKSIGESVDEIFDLFIGEKAIIYAENRLEERYPEFNNLMREYKEGILLFDITKDFVWDKAAQDTTAIRSFYSVNKDRYKWGERVRFTNYSLRTTDPTIITPILNASRKKSPEELIEEFNVESDIIVHKTEILDRDHETLKGIQISEGTISPPEFHNNLKVTTFRKIEEILPPRLKTLKEARGYVISDYQDQLDKEWIDELRKEYKVKIEKKALKNLIIK